jgi:hypothetical protein
MSLSKVRALAEPTGEYLTLASSITTTFPSSV